MMKKYVALIAVSWLAVSAHGEEVVLKSLQGNVTVRRANTKKWFPARAGIKLNLNDQVKTAGAALAQVVIDSGATLLVKEKSWFSLKQDKRGRIVSFRIGEFLIGLKKKADYRQKFRVRTPVSVASVRGTVFWGKSDEAEVTSYACFTGSIEIWGQGQSVVLEPGQATTISPNEAPLTPQPSTIPKEYVETFRIDNSLGDIDELLAEQ